MAQINVSMRGKVIATLNAESTDDDGSGRPFFGEMSMIDNTPRTATMQTRTPCTLLVLQRKVFTQFMLMVPDFSSRLRAYKELRAKQTELNLAIQAQRQQKRVYEDTTDANADRVNRLVRAGNLLGN